MFKVLWAEAKYYSCGMQGKMANLPMASFFLSLSCYVKIWIRTHVYTRAYFFLSFFFSKCPQVSGNVTSNVLLALLQRPLDSHFLSR